MSRNLGDLIDFSSIGGKDSFGSLSDIFEEEPVDLDIFVKDHKFLGMDNIELSPVQKEVIKHTERVYYPELYPLMAKEFNSEYWAEPIPMRNLITVQWGKGSGKDSISRIANLRITYLLLCLKSPQRYFGMPEFDSIHLLNIARSAPQAKNAFFTPMTKAVRRGWFRDKADPKMNMITYDKNIEAISGHSEAESQEGLNLILGVADEIDGFKAANEMVGRGRQAREASTSAEHILDMMKTSASTRFPKTYKRVAISYPRYLGSTIQKLTVEGRESNKKYGEKSIHYVSGPLATWDVNPRVSGPEEYSEDYDKDPDAAAAKYECKPSRAVDAYFRNMVIFRDSVDRDAQPITIDYETKPFYSPVTKQTLQLWEPVFHFAKNFQPIEGAIYAMHADLALTQDRAGIALSHVERWAEFTHMVEDHEGTPQKVTDTLPIVRNDFTIAFEADPGAKPPREIQIRWARVLAFELIKRGFVIGSFTLDGFQSADTIQAFLRLGIESDRVSTDRNADIWKSLKDVASEGRLHMPFDQLLLDELEGLSNVDGKVDHPPGGSKDLADAFACSIAGAILLGGEEDPNGSIVKSGAEVFASGNSLEGLAGYDSVSETVGNPMGMPLGMDGMKLYG